MYLSLEFAFPFVSRSNRNEIKISLERARIIRSKSHDNCPLISKFHRILMELCLPFRGLSYRNRVMIHPSITNAGTRKYSENAPSKYNRIIIGTANGMQSEIQRVERVRSSFFLFSKLDSRTISSVAAIIGRLIVSR